MTVKIHRGTKEIGGICVELEAENGKKLWIDLGLPLDNTNPNTEYANTQQPDALIISHSHQDHYGLMEKLDRKVPIYIGKVTLDLINASRLFLNTQPAQGNFQIISSWEEFTVENTFKVKPFLVDHSSPEAFAFLIEADGKKVFYSGDFRATGRKKKLYESFIANPPKDIDLLLIEGTMVERNNHKYPTEDDVEQGIYEVVKHQQNITFVASSAQNLDRFVSVFKACKRAQKQVIVDIYNAWVLEIVKKKSPNLPTIEWDNIHAYKHPSQFDKIVSEEFCNFRKLVEEKSKSYDIFKEPYKYVYFLRCPNEKLIESLVPRGKINLIYSQWEGYLEEAHKTYFTDTINKIKSNSEFNFQSIHTSGHATLNELKEFSKALNPKQIAPIHTNNSEKFLEEFRNAGFENVVIWEDSQKYNL